MRVSGIQLSPWHKRWFYLVATLLFVTGAIWLGFNWRAQHSESIENDFGSIKHWSLMFHGAGAMAFLIEMGILIPTHITRAWPAGRNRVNGVILIVTTAMLVVTGYGLYYFGEERWRSVASWVHSILGLAAPVVLAIHIWLGRRKRTLED